MCMSQTCACQVCVHDTHLESSVYVSNACMCMSVCLYECMCVSVYVGVFLCTCVFVCV